MLTPVHDSNCTGNKQACFGCRASQRPLRHGIIIMTHRLIAVPGLLSCIYPVRGSSLRWRPRCGCTLWHVPVYVN